jgi:hypothetical protein
MRNVGKILKVVFGIIFVGTVFRLVRGLSKVSERFPRSDLGRSVFGGLVRGFAEVSEVGPRKMGLYSFYSFSEVGPRKVCGN